MNSVKKIFKYFERPYHCWIPKNLKRKVKKLDSIEYDIVSHCNLNCKGCTHFAPIAKKWFVKIEDFKKDIERTSKLIPEKNLGCFYILGGEPLLHPQIIEIIEIARRSYYHIPIKIITNGLLLEKMKNDFWDACEKNRIIIEITKYPINYDYSIIEKLIAEKRKQVKIEYKGRTKFLKKKQYKLPLDCNGQQDKVYGFTHCHMAGHCINLANGHLYTCSYAAYIDKFNEYFNKNIPLTDKDGVDIYECNNTNEAIEKLTNPIPLCEYCNVKSRTYGNEWGISKRDISEWTV